MIEIKVKFIDNRAILPSYAHEDDAGLDLYSIDEKVLLPNESSLIRTGLVIELPPGLEAQIRPRSGLSLKHQITVLNSPGTVDSGYRGEIGVILINHGKKEFRIDPGMRIAQIVIKPVLKANVIEDSNITSTSRGKNGFGSSGYQ